MIFHCLLLSLTLCQMIHDRPVAALTAAHAATLAWDATETHIGIHSGYGEGDPLLRPFVHTTAVHVAAAGVEVLATAYVAEKMKHSRHAILRKMYWVPQIALTGAHVYGGIRWERFKGR